MTEAAYHRKVYRIPVRVSSSSCDLGRMVGGAYPHGSSRGTAVRKRSFVHMAEWSLNPGRRHS